MSEALPEPEPPCGASLATSRKGLLLALALVLAVYVGLALWFAGTKSIWSPDCGARLIQVQSILEHGPDWSVIYPGKELDPHHRNSPLAFYEYNHGGKTYVFYSFLFALLTAPFFQALGYFGLAVPAILGGLAAVAGTWAVARRLEFRYPLAPALITGLATPLALYSVVFWDHSILAGIATFALYFALRGAEENRGRFWFAAGALLGAGIWFHEILAPYILALIVGAWWLRARHSWVRNSGWFVAGALLLIIPLAIINYRVYGSPAGPHLANNKLGSAQAIFQYLLTPGEWGLGMVYSLIGWGDANPAFTWQLKNWVAKPWPKFELEIRASLLMAIPLILWVPLATTGLWRQARWLATGVLLVMAGSAWWVLTHNEWPHSPFYATPALALAFLAPLRRGEADEGDRRRDLLQAVALVTLLYTFVTLLKPTLGGTEWGSRHLLSVLPALILLAWAAVEWMVRRERDPAQPVLAAGAALLVLSVAILIHGMQVVHRMHANTRRLTDAVLRNPDEVIVTTVWWAPLNMAPAYPEKKLVFAGDVEHPAPQLFTRMRAQGVRTFSVLSYNPEDLMAFAIPVGYAPIEGATQELPLRLWTQRYALVAAPTDAELPPPPPGDTLPPPH